MRVSVSAVVAVSGRSLLRDPVLRLMAVMPIVVALAFRLLVPVADAALTRAVDPEIFRLLEYYPIISAFLIQLAGMFAGGVTGFSLLEDRDEGVFAAMAATPLGRGGYIASRLVFPGIAATVGSAVVVPLAALHVPEPGSFVCALIAAAPLAPSVSLLLSGLAGNKVEGLAVFKLLGLLFLGPLVVALPPSFHFVGWPLASYWAARAYLASVPAAAGHATLSVLCSLAYAAVAFRFCCHFPRASVE
jgi:hypothetical protein